MVVVNNGARYHLFHSTASGAWKFFFNHGVEEELSRGNLKVLDGEMISDLPAIVCAKKPNFVFLFVSVLSVEKYFHPTV